MKPAMNTTEVKFTYEGIAVTFESVHSEDHILRAIRDSGTFYERDVLERVREALARARRTGNAMDVGSFIGTHSLFFATFCGLGHVQAFEANPDTFPVLERNIRANGLAGKVVAANTALGSHAGNARILFGEAGNAGSTRVEFDDGDGGTQVSTIDLEAAGAGGEISLIKIDVEGAELEVLAGGVEVIRKHRPILCVEIHTTEHLRQVLRMLDGSSYWIVDCLGWSPTYIIEPADVGGLRRGLVNGAWVLRTMLPASWKGARGYVRRLGQVLSAGWWDLSRVKA